MSTHMTHKLSSFGRRPLPEGYNSPAAFTKYVNDDIAKWLDLSKKTGIKLSN